MYEFITVRKLFYTSTNSGSRIAHVACSKLAPVISSLALKYTAMTLVLNRPNAFHCEHIWAVTWDFQQYGILTSVDTDERVQPPFKLRNSKWCSVSSLTFIEYSSDEQKFWSDCVYAQADLRYCWSHIPHCWKSHALAHFWVQSVILARKLSSIDVSVMSKSRHHVLLHPSVFGTSRSLFLIRKVNGKQASWCQTVILGTDFSIPPSYMMDLYNLALA